MSINKKMDKVRQLDQQGNRQGAFDLIDILISEYPNEARLWSLQGSLHARSRNYSEAISSITKALSISPQTATYYYHRGRYNFNLGNFLEATIDLNETLSKDNYDDISFTQEVRFHLAEALIMLGKKQEALIELSHIPDNYQTWTYKLRNKSELVTDCLEL